MDRDRIGTGAMGRYQYVPSRHSSPTSSSDTGPDTARDEKTRTKSTVVDRTHDLVHLLGPIGSTPRSGERGGAQRRTQGSCNTTSSTWEGRGSCSRPWIRAPTVGHVTVLLESAAQATGPSAGFTGFTASLPPGPACRGYGYRAREVAM
jgi:hypothetical protein